MNSGKVLLGVLAGAAVGAAVGLLLAPEKGSVSRNQISQKGEDFWDNLRDKFEDLISSARSEVEDVKDEAEDLYAKGKEKVNKTKNEAENLYAQGKEKVMDAKNDLKANANLH